MCSHIALLSDYEKYENGQFERSEINYLAKTSWNSKNYFFVPLPSDNCEYYFGMRNNMRKNKPKTLPIPTKNLPDNIGNEMYYYMSVVLDTEGNLNTYACDSSWGTYVSKIEVKEKKRNRKGDYYIVNVYITTDGVERNISEYNMGEKYVVGIL